MTLSEHRVLDLTDEKGWLCGKILADLGAQVIKVEKPNGDPSRSLGPFVGDILEPERSLPWLAYNQGKKGITLDIESPEGQELFRNLAKIADIVIDSFQPGYAEALALDYSVLSQLHPGLIVCSITPFGQLGPYRDYKGADLVIAALGGLMYLCGDPDRAPLRASSSVTYAMTCADAAVACLIALYHRNRTGLGQRIDVSAQESVAHLALFAPLSFELDGKLVERYGQFRLLTVGAKTRTIWECKDGFVVFPIWGGQLGARMNSRLLAWIESEGSADDFLTAIDWGRLDMASVDQQFLIELERRLGEFFKQHTKVELDRGAVERNIILNAAYTMDDLLVSPQLQARNFWAEVEHPEIGMTITYPGSFFRAPLLPGRTARRAPLVGEHNREVYGEWLRLSQGQLDALGERRVI